jgi:hypothetical protein
MRQGATWPVVVTESHPGETSSVTVKGTLDLDPLALEAVAGPAAYGEILGSRLFTGNTLRAFDNARATSGDELHVMLSIEDETLRSLRWERLCAPIDDELAPLAFDQRTPFALHIATDLHRTFPTLYRSSLRMLILVACPDGLDDYELHQFDQLRAVQSVTSALNNSVPCDVLGTVPGAVGPPTLTELCEVLTSGKHTLLHVICHGAFFREEGECVLYLAGEDGRVAVVRAADVVERLRLLSRLPYLVFLSTCQTAQPEAEGSLGGLAHRLVRQLAIPAVIAMTDRITVETVQGLAEVFYRQFLQHGLVDKALAEGFVGIVHRRDAPIPVLISRLGAQRLYLDEAPRASTVASVETKVSQTGPVPPETGAPIFLIASDRGDPDRLLACDLSDGLRAAGYKVFHEVDARPGSAYASWLSEALAVCSHLVVLLSARSVHSEAVWAIARLSHARRVEGGIPWLLPVRVAYQGPLGYPLRVWVDVSDWIAWGGAQDTGLVLARIVDVVEGRSQPPPTNPIRPALSGLDAADDVSAGDSESPYFDVPAPGFAMRPDDPFYIRREADDEVDDMVRRLGDVLVVRAPRQMGKSSLLTRYLNGCGKSGKQTVSLDLSLIESPILADYSNFLTSIATALLDNLQLGESPRIGSQMALTVLFRDRILKVISENVVIAFDEADRILGQPYQSDFFAMLRSWLDRRADTTEPHWARFELALVISTEPNLLIRDPLRSPFNRNAIFLRPFNSDECRQLNERYPGLLSPADAERLRVELLNGHPYLTRRAYYELARSRRASLGSLLASAHSLDGPFGDHLRALLVLLQEYPGGELLEALGRIIRGGAVSDQVILARLVGAGLLRWEGSRIIPANRLYAQFFGALTDGRTGAANAAGRWSS